MTQGTSSETNMNNSSEHAEKTKRVSALMNHSLFGKLFRFAGVGAITGLIYVIAVAVLVGFLGIDAKWASITGYLIALPISFLAHKRITFRSRNQPLAEALRFCILHGANILVSFVGMFLVVDWLGYSYWLGSVLVVASVPISTFVVMNLWVFAQSSD